MGGITNSARRSHALNGLVLCGGHSTRMGRDKGLLEYHGKPQRAHLFDLLMKYCAAVHTSCRRQQNVPDLLNPLYDAGNLRGPLNGILTAFEECPTAWLVVAVDMPFVDGAVIETLMANRDPSVLATCFFNAQTKAPEPLLTIWEPRAHPLLTDFCRQGGDSPRRFLEQHPVRTIDPPDGRVLVNINSVEVLKC